jgi:hypothetical protein
LVLPAAVVLVWQSGCTAKDEEQAKRKLHEAGQELKHDTREATQKLKQGANEAGQELRHDAHAASREIKKGSEKLKQKADSK